jgi:hypothetical protein
MALPKHQACIPNPSHEFGLDRYGPLVGGPELERLLGYTSNSAFRQAVHRGRLPVKVFTLPDRRGKFAFTSDIAKWLLALRMHVGSTEQSTLVVDERTACASSDAGRVRNQSRKEPP